MPEPVYSPSYDSPEPEAPRTVWKWNHFEVRTLVCLIIKGEHKISKDPMDLTDKLNRALNPASSATQPAYSRDIPHAEVQAMLKRILSKKSHAVDLSDRNYSAPVTRAKLNAFMRNFDFDGSKDEWKAGRGKVVRVETQKRLVRFMIRKEGGRPSPRSRDERDRRRMLLRDPTAKRLLRGWGIGASFWEDGSKGEEHTMNGNKDRGSSSATVNPARHLYSTDKAPSLPAGGFANIPSTPNSVAMWAGGFASSAATPLAGAMVPPSMPLMRGPDVAQQATMLDYGSYGGFDSLTNPQKQPYQWTGAEQNGAWGGSGVPAGDQRHPSSSQHVGRGF
ncbi:hypothetical protein SLS64_004934 [Diaporthe eres]|uniref:Clr5 domain-containing protein n=1 Tax=Diaporthe eres TaxID=83184 RepID=A0ABR1P7U5_DIAER